MDKKCKRECEVRLKQYIYFFLLTAFLMVCVRALDRTRMVSKLVGYKTISEAIASSKEGNVIIVFPGTYDEIVQLRDNDIRLIGVNKDKCIIQNTTGIFDNAPLYAYGDFSVSNMTIKMTLENGADFIPTYEGRFIGTTFPGFAVSIDHENSTRNPHEIHIGNLTNCVVYSEAFPAAGVGLNENQRVIFDKCKFVRNVSDDKKSFFIDGFTGAFMGRSSNYAVENQYLEIRNCYFSSNGEFAASFLMTYAGEKGAEITAINNAFSSENNMVEYDKGESLLNAASRDNTVDCLNANSYEDG